ncbi:XdhC family protein [Sedimentitalea sp. JM2-8]|uniref:XdhC family protein n=1 Tax=Sedimentitalea xiamensis TaxID=3050037 RepID=A0ABT7FEG3_9RHOB|nr:XdhC family protein [Sedimentitalea xiamensis]MDK3073509.1 XdhC family protein [Sedimentitalea xiamensis]
MTLSRHDLARLDAEMQWLKDRGVPFAVATVVRTVDATSAKPGDKALVDRDGTILMGWVGGGCARAAVGRAARETIRSGRPQLISLRPQEVLETEGLAAGELRDGVRIARNGCPSKGTMDIFVEPILPLPRLAIFGQGLVAHALADLADRFDLDRLMIVPAPEDIAPGTADRVVAAGDTLDPPPRFAVVATQGSGDTDALRTAVTSGADYVAFVGSARKFATLSARLRAEDPALGLRLDRVHAPAGLHINAITPQEIALSVLAQITALRRAGDRRDETGD